MRRSLFCAPGWRVASLVVAIATLALLARMWDVWRTDRYQRPEVHCIDGEVAISRLHLITGWREFRCVSPADRK